MLGQVVKHQAETRSGRDIFANQPTELILPELTTTKRRV